MHTRYKKRSIRKSRVAKWQLGGSHVLGSIPPGPFFAPRFAQKLKSFRAIKNSTNRIPHMETS